MIFDSHAHYDDEAFDKDRYEVIEELKNNGIIGVLDCGSSIEALRISFKLAQEIDFFYSAVGIHPEYSDKFDDNIENELKELAGNAKVRAIGEIGLDYHYEENPPRKIQLDTFDRQMALAEELKLPVVIHDREAHEDTLNMIKKYPHVKGVIHCFSGSAEFAKECLKLGYYIGFTGVITFKNARKIVEAAKEVPIDRILVETDCPYMSPVPYRGQRNRSENIKYILEKLCDIKHVSMNELCDATISNTKELLKLG